MKIYVELDGVVSNNNHRADRRHAFDEYWNESLNDSVKKPVVELLQSLQDEVDIVLFSCRPESMRYQTEEWIRDREIPCDDLLLRGEDDRSKEADLRESFVLGDGSLTKALRETRFVLVNNETAVEGFRELGFTVIQTDW